MPDLYHEDEVGEEGVDAPSTPQGLQRRARGRGQPLGRSFRWGTGRTCGCSSASSTVDMAQPRACESAGELTSLLRSVWLSAPLCSLATGLRYDISARLAQP